jgi:leucyl aminopeptidase
MTTKEVEELVSECATKMDRHTGFMDVTETPDLISLPQRKVYIPSGPTHQALVYRLNEKVSISNIWSTITTLSAYQTRYYTTQTGVSAVTWLEQQYRSIAGSRLNNDITVYRWAHSWAQPSLVVEIRGTKYPTQRVIIGGHIDSTAGSGGSSRAPGADDDASGSATVLEAFRVLATDPDYRPERTLEFQAYAAEEVGLRGSQEIAQYYYDYGFNVIGMLQLDMTGYVGSRRAIGVITDYTNPALTSFMRQCIGAYCNLPAESTTCGYACSDHASFYRVGFPACHAFESSGTFNPNIHTQYDTIDELDKNLALDFGYLAVGYMVELGFGETSEEIIDY